MGFTLLSYQHAFHAGNHADVLKHLVLIAILQRLKQKSKPYFALDTHAGEGLYDLSQSPKMADATAFEGVITGTYSNESVLSLYAKHINTMQKKALYPGSPSIMQAFSREIDTLHANELSSDICQRLRDNIVSDNMHIHQRDAFEVLNALLPPEPKRGLVLIDPPYEQALEYQKLTIELEKALKKWPRGIYAIWYPMLSPKRINRRSGLIEDTPKASLAGKMLNTVTEIAAKRCSGGVIDIQFAAMAANEETGMYGSGVVIINPPYLLESDLKEILEALCDKVKVDNNRLSNLKWRLAAA